MLKTIQETDLFIPTKQLFEAMGYQVQGEVKDVDLMAIHPDDAMPLLVEFKLTLSFKLVLQGVKRQRLSDYVYVAIEKPASRVLRSNLFKDKLHLLKRLELGLIYVTLGQNTYAQIIHEPLPFDRKRAMSASKKRQAALFKEFKARHNTLNIGGTKGKTMTAYKESALYLVYLMQEGPLTTAQAKAALENEKASQILIKNYYGWYERIQKGVYTLTPTGQMALTQYREMLSVFRRD